MPYIEYKPVEYQVVQQIELTDSCIKKLADALKQKTGKWMIEDCHAATYKYCCSECNAHHRARYDFCPTCGARMECGGEE